MKALSGLYYGRYARERIAEAQEVLDEHVTSAYTGCCLRYGRPGPCPEAVDAEGVLARYRWLPRRRPGASLAGDPSRSSFDWFGDASTAGQASMLAASTRGTATEPGRSRGDHPFAGRLQGLALFVRPYVTHHDGGRP